MTDSFVMEVEIRGCVFDVEVHVHVSAGGSNSYGSDEPEWFSLEVEDIFNQRRKKPVSNKLFGEIVKNYENAFVDKFF